VCLVVVCMWMFGGCVYVCVCGECVDVCMWMFGGSERR